MLTRKTSGLVRVLALSLIWLWLPVLGGAQSPIETASNAIGVDSNRNAYVVGTIKRSENDTDIAVVKYNPDGGFVWNQFLDGIGSYDYGMGLLVGRNYVIAAGSVSTDGGEEHIAVAKFTLDGQQRWFAAYSGLGGHSTIERGGIVRGPGGRFYIAAKTSPDAARTDLTVLAYNLRGRLLWAKRFHSPGNPIYHARIAGIDRGGNIYAAANSIEADSPLFFVKYSPAGRRLWARRYLPGVGLFNDFSATVDRDGGLYVAALVSTSELAARVKILRYSDAGRLLWDKFVPEPVCGLGMAITRDARGRVVVAYNAAGTMNVNWYNRGGRLLESFPFGGMYPNYTFPTEIKADSSSNVYLAGSYSLLAPNGVLVSQVGFFGAKFYGPGSLYWSQVFSRAWSGHDGGARAVAFDSAGQTYLTGQVSLEMAGVDAFGTVKYGDGGSEDWYDYYWGQY